MALLPRAARTGTPAQIVPEGSAYSPSRQMWRDPQGNLYDAPGARMTPGASQKYFEIGDHEWTA
jgi:hypothetical protein